MSKVTGVILSTDEHPLRELAHLIWGTNIVRTAADIAAAPPSIGEAFQKFKTTPSFTLRCGCCGEPMRKVKGMAVLRLNKPDMEMIPVGLCKECLQESDDNKLHKRILKELTGLDRKVVDWKDTLQ